LTFVELCRRYAYAAGVSLAAEPRDVHSEQGGAHAWISPDMEIVMAR
jgi:hypothetical protein